MNFRENLIDSFGKHILKKSSLSIDGWYENMLELMGNDYYNTILEIGTFKGVSAAFLSEYCSDLITIDILDPRFKDDPDFNPCILWDKIGIKNITYYAVKNDVEKINIVNGLNFNFAYIDGDHGKGALIDWLLVNKCGNVLFHDYGGDHSNDYWNMKYCPIKDLVDSLPEDEIKIKGVNALWKKI